MAVVVVDILATIDCRLFARTCARNIRIVDDDDDHTKTNHHDDETKQQHADNTG